MVRPVVSCLVVLAATISVLAGQSVRVVDSVVVGAADDEASHHFSGSGTMTGASGGRTWRSATGSLSYSLRIYDDSPLTIICLVAGSESLESFDILVDGRKVSTMTRTPSPEAGEFKVSVPLAATEGKTEVVVKFAARAGRSTARLLEVRSVQEHLE